jgi:hypothetical protein
MRAVELALPQENCWPNIPICNSLSYQTNYGYALIIGDESLCTCDSFVSTKDLFIDNYLSGASFRMRHRLVRLFARAKWVRCHNRRP